MFEGLRAYAAAIYGRAFPNTVIMAPHDRNIYRMP